MAEEKRVAPRVVGHVEKLREAGLNTEAFFNALIGIRDDSALPTAQREALYRMVAIESYVWYLEALRGEPVDRLKLMQEAADVAEKNGAAIKKRTPGDSSLELAARDISRRPAGMAPPGDLTPDATTRSERAPRPEGRAQPSPSPRTPPKKK